MAKFLRRRAYSRAHQYVVFSSKQPQYQIQSRADLELVPGQLGLYASSQRSEVVQAEICAEQARRAASDARKGSVTIKFRPSQY
eukprot:m.6393 g.6393  ORF g.6393 m.6393 type:complete len:84 (+) comp8435_c0_seq4:673-924(+)